jgi:hypothetical protein
MPRCVVLVHGPTSQAPLRSPACTAMRPQTYAHSATGVISEHLPTPSRVPSLRPSLRPSPHPPLLGVPGSFCVCSQRHNEMIKSAPTEHSSAPPAFVHPSYQAQARSRARKDGIPLRPRSHLGPFPLRPRSHSCPLPLCSIPTCRFPLSHRLPT